MALSYCQTIADVQGRELTVHGTTAFPIACYFDDLQINPVPWHWHDELEAVVVADGTCVFTVGSQKHTLQKGDGIFINAGILHSVSEIGNCHLHSICFHPRLVGGSLDSVFWQDYLQPLIADISLDCITLSSSTDWQQNCMDSIEEAWQACVAEKSGYEFHVRARLSLLIWLAASHRPLTKTVPSEKSLRDGERIKTMLQYIQEHFSEKINTSQIAASALISGSECLRCFRNTIGITPIQYVKQYRIRRAAHLLTSTAEKIINIGTQCGFQEMSYFAKAFKEIMGCTPSEYRRRNAMGDSESFQASLPDC